MTETSMRFLFLSSLLVACGPSARSDSTVPTADVDAAIVRDSNLVTGDAFDDGCGGLSNCYSVYAHADHTLYVIDLTTKQLQTVGAFNAPMVGTGTAAAEDVITDLAVAPDGMIWVVSETALYTASSVDGHVTKVGSLAACGTRAVALTFTPAGKLYTGDYKGALCEIDTTQSPPIVNPPLTLGGGMALSGDLVAVGDGTVFGTVYRLSDMPGKGSNLSNVLAKIDLATGVVTQVGPSGFPKLFGVSFAHGTVIGFTHDGTGNVIEMNLLTGAGTVMATFVDPATSKGISFAGAGVNALVPILQ